MVITKKYKIHFINHFLQSFTLLWDIVIIKGSHWTKHISFVQ